MAELIRDHWLLSLVVAGSILYVAFQLSSDAPVARRIFSRFLFNIVLPLIIIMGMPLLLLALYSNLDERIWQAIIAGLVIATGWLTTAIFNQLAKAEHKGERLRDYHKAIYAEIGNALQNLWDQGHSEQIGAQMIERMEADPSFVPFIPKEQHDYVFDSILDEIEVLPRQTIDAIVAYYSQIKSIAALADDMRDEAFHDLPQNRRIAVYADYLSMRKQAFAFGQHALKLILAFADGGAPAAEKVARDAAHRAASSPDVAPSAPSPGSE